MKTGQTRDLRVLCWRVCYFKAADFATEAGWLASRQWARGPTTTYNYTKAGEINSVDYSDSTPDVIGMNYDKGGRLTTVIDISGSRTITYNDYDQRKDETYASGSAPLSGYAITRGFSSDRMTSLAATGPSGFSYATVNYAWNYGTSPRTVVLSGGVAATYTLQPGMRQPQTVTIGSGGGTLTRSHGYDALGRTTYVSNAVGSTVVSAHGTASVPITYDAAGRRTEIPREDGGKWVYGYNDRDEVTSGVRRFSGGGPVPGHQFTYAYDGLGNRLAAAVGGDQGGANLAPVSYTLNNLNQYTALTNPTSQWITGSALDTAQVFINGDWAWRNGTFFGKSIGLGNGSGPNWKNVTIESKILPGGGGSTMTVATQSGSLLVPPASISPSYDDDGNLVGDGLWVYTWDGENRLKAMETVSGVPAAGQRKLEFAYDFEGRRVQTTRYTKPSGSWVADSAGPTIYLYDGWNIIGEHNGSVTRHYIWGPDLSGTMQGAGGIGGLVAMQDSATSKSYFYAYDSNGNVTALVDMSSGAIVAQYEYGPFGESLRTSGVMASASPFRWSSKYTDNEDGLSYYGYRVYNSSVGRWNGRDRLGENGGVNLYGFVKNNSINKVDVLGMEDYVTGDDLDDLLRDGATKALRKTLEPVLDWKPKEPDSPFDKPKPNQAPNTDALVEWSGGVCACVTDEKINPDKHKYVLIPELFEGTRLESPVGKGIGVCHAMGGQLAGYFHSHPPSGGRSDQDWNNWVNPTRKDGNPNALYGLSSAIAYFKAWKKDPSDKSKLKIPLEYEQEISPPTPPPNWPSP